MSDEQAPRRRASDHALAPLGQPARAGDSAFEAQLLAQGTIKRGLRGGKEVLDAARSTYLKTEWSGPTDRRPRQGQVAKTKV